MLKYIHRYFYVSATYRYPFYNVKIGTIKFLRNVIKIEESRKKNNHLDIP